jgi:thiosulfate dehydrogenase (quinone) large subunit
MNTATSAWEQRLQQAAIVIMRVVLAVLFFSQLGWKMPPTFGCPPDFAFTTANAEGRLQRTTGLCDWIGVEEVWSERPHPLLGGAIDIAPLAQLNGLFLRNVVQPNIQWFGYIIWGSEAFIFVSLLLGLFSRLGGLVALGISGQLLVGLAGISNPYEWEWSYNQLFLLAFLAFALAPGRILGIDAWLRPRLANQRNPLARLVYAFT